MSAAQKKRKRSAPRPEKNIIRAPGTVLTTRHVTIEGTKSISVEKKLVGVSPRKPVAKAVAESPVESPPLEQSDGPESAEEIKKTQVREVLDRNSVELIQSSAECAAPGRVRGQIAQYHTLLGCSQG